MRKSSRVGNVEPTTLPEGTLASGLGFRDYVDAYRVILDRQAFPNVDALARAFLLPPPSWIRWALAARDAAVGPFGIERAGVERPRGGPGDLAPGTRAGIFEVIERSDHEIVLGKDDRHLDFRVSLVHLEDGDDCAGIVATLVRFHNALGRAYFVPVAPLHRRIVKTMLRRAAATGR